MSADGASAPARPAARRRTEQDREFFVGLARACAGSVIFTLPMLMTMELWSLGVYLGPWKMVVLLVVLVPLLTGLSTVSGFRETASLRDDAVDAFVAIAVAAVVSAVVLFAFGVVTPETPASEAVGRLILQVFPGGIGAMLAQSQVSGESVGEGGSGQRQSYGSELLLMAVGALFLGLSVAPTEEVVLLAYRMGPWRELALALLSLALMHAFVYAVEFHGWGAPKADAAFWSLFLRYTVVGYAIVLLVSLCLLWIFGQADGTAFTSLVGPCVVLGFPCAIGAAAARLVL